MGIFDRFTSKKEKELKKDAPKEVAKEAATKEVKKESKGVEKAPKGKKAATSEAKKSPADTSGILKAPVITEKTAHAAGKGQYAFEVKKDATKIDVRRAVEKTYGVHVTGVQTQIVRGKYVRFGQTMGKRSTWKKAVVSLKAGERLDIYEASVK